MNKGEHYTGVGVVFICHDGAGRYLLNKRSAQCRDEHGRWDIGGGGVEFGETIQETLKKELQEEFNVEPLECDFLGFREVHREHEGRPTHWVMFDHRVHIDPCKVVNNEPHKFEELAWFGLDKFPEPMHSQWPYFLEAYCDRL